jgi:3',5'-cyclic AMP phosphodiesterase CpdA
VRVVRRLTLAFVAWVGVAAATVPVAVPAPLPRVLPARADSLKFAAIGDSGTGDRPQYEVGQRMATERMRFPFELVIMLGDNMYGRQQPEDFVTKFERPYAALLSAGVVFFASLGNHDNPRNAQYEPFHMGGERYYTFNRKNTRFFVLDSNQMDPKQLAWIEDALSQSQDEWKICYFHHPLYSNGGRHGSNVQLRVALEPLLIKHGVNLVFSGHDHIYERLTPQKGITYFVSGSAGELRKGDVRPTSETAAYFDQDQSFMLLEIAGDQLFYEAVSRTGKAVDSGVIRRRGARTTDGS